MGQSALDMTHDEGIYSGKYLRIDIDDPANVDNYIEAGRLLAGDFIEPTYNSSPTNSISFVDPSQSFKSYGQTTWINKRNKYRMGRFRFDYLTEEEARVDFYKLLSIAGSSKPLVYLPFLENSFRSYTDTIYGVLRNVGEPYRIEQTRVGYKKANYRVDLEIEELL